MKISREWAMPNHLTFSIGPISDLIAAHGFGVSGKVFLDPFCRESPFKETCVTNDLDPDVRADFHMDALDFMRTRGDESADGVLFDPPYSLRQVSEVYKKMDRAVNSETTTAKFWADLKKEIARVLKPGAISISFGWNSGGIGKSLGMTLEEVLLVAHGGWHNDTIATVEIKEETLFSTTIK